MPTTRRSRRIAAPLDDVWGVVRDPHHLPRWWPKVARVEAVSPEHWTKVMLTERGRPVRADYHLLEEQGGPPARRSWEQELAGSPFERILARAQEEVVLEPAGDATVATLVARQRLRGMARFGGFMVRRATRRQLDEALENLARAVGA